MPDFAGHGANLTRPLCAQSRACQPNSCRAHLFVRPEAFTYWLGISAGIALFWNWQKEQARTCQMFTRVPRYFARDSADLAALSELTVSTAERNAHDISQGSLCSDGMVSGAAVRLRGFWRIVAGRRGVIGHG